MKALIAILAVVAVCQARIITVDDDGPADFDNIQAAIDDANDGDTIILAEGTYTGPGNRDIDFKGKPITVRSRDPNNLTIVEATVIDCEGSGSEPHRGFYFPSTTTASSVIAGLTITNGYGLSEPYRSLGGAIFCGYGSSPTISHCRVVGNRAESGGAIYCRNNSNPVVTHCIIAANSATLSGGGIASRDSKPTITHSTIAHNTADRAGGVYCYNFSTSTFNPRISHSILWNDADREIVTSENPKVLYSNIKGGWPGAGNIDADPCFLDATGGDYHLSARSPCINAGDPGYSPGPGETDIDGEPRVINGRIDIGADESSFYGPQFKLSVTEFECSSYEGGPNPEAQAFTIENIGTGTLNWEVTEECSWVDVVPPSGSCADEIDEVTVSIHIEDLPEGEHICELTVSDSNAVNSPRTVNVKLHLVESKAVVNYFAETYAYAYADVDGYTIDEEEDQDNLINAETESAANALSRPSVIPEYWTEQRSHVVATVGATGTPDGAQLVSQIKGWGEMEIFDIDVGRFTIPGAGKGNGYNSLSGAINIGTPEESLEGPTGTTLVATAEIVGDTPAAWDTWDWLLMVWDDDPNNPLAVLNDSNMSANVEVAAGRILHIEFYHEAEEASSWPAMGLKSTTVIDLNFPIPSNVADLNRDGDVDGVDFAILGSQWGEPPGIPSADIAPPGGDGIVDERDLAVFTKSWVSRQ